MKVAGKSNTSPARRKVRVLFVCSRNYCRSMTAEVIYKGVPGYDVRSAGVELSARVLVTEKLIKWADFVFVMENYHEQMLQVRFGDLLKGKSIICLNIPDKFRPMNRDLVDRITLEMRSYVPTLALRSKGRFYLQP